MGSESTARSRKVMVVADPSRESAGALQYALSHVVVENDELILLHVESSYSWWNTFSFRKVYSLTPPGPMPNSSEGGGGVGDGDFLEAMRQVCQIAQPKIPVRLERTPLMEETKDKANTILSKSNLLSVDLLIIGQRRGFSTAILGTSRYKLSGGSGTKGSDTAEYLIEKSKCTCVAVQKRGQNAGYVLNTKTHKNFWLLA
ncbi:ADENINE NUCLEOTIDE ALPHA HYDROLASES-LIKE SUPERFAMILY PROTEIN [Salix viminalis]|uniref:ADENINE NUCLEOTIDE ALPHA HYDROLASES-LIKE SUPERFAMILY PROTEIN n=1 Tax=Salix viminalis TaxID=40686 RepID=A0A6N2NH82_SALVM|nr:ADENINE NUCLEOTIDE ALPHA HYDROLASES-LIKE SUPERFAMILY PROTEIN [Salix viminalis]